MLEKHSVLNVSFHEMVQRQIFHIRIPVKVDNPLQEIDGCLFVWLVDPRQAERFPKISRRALCVGEQTILEPERLIKNKLDKAL